MKNWVSGLPWPPIACALHALLVTAIWVLVFKFDLDVMPGRLWMVLALAWLLWLGAVVFSRRENRVKWIIAIAVGVLLLAPTIPTLYTFVVWSVEGFAP